MESKAVLIVSYANYKTKCAGTEKFIAGIIEELNNNSIHSIQVFPIIGLNYKLGQIFKKSSGFFGMNIDGNFEGIFYQDDFKNTILSVLDKYCFELTCLFLNQLDGWKLEILESFINNYDLETIIYIHDYMTVCNYMLLEDGNQLNCARTIEAPGGRFCKKCKHRYAAMSQFARNREFFDTIDKNIKYIVFPSEIAKNNWFRVFGKCKDRLLVRDHLLYNTIENNKTSNKKIRIAYLGFISNLKGFDAFIKLYQNHKNEFDFYYFGKFVDEAKKYGIQKTIYVNFNDKKSLSMTEELRKNNIDLAFLWSECQETYSYTFFEAFEAGCFCVSNEYSGNIANSIEKYHNGKTFENFTACSNWLITLIEDKSEIDYYFRYGKRINQVVSNSDISFIPTSNTKINECIRKEYNRQKFHIVNHILTQIYMYKFKNAYSNL